MPRRNLSSELTALLEAAERRDVDLVLTRRRKPVRHWAIASAGAPASATDPDAERVPVELSAEPELLDAVTAATAALAVAGTAAAPAKASQA